MKKFKFCIFRDKTLKKIFTGEVSTFILIPILPTYGFFRRLRITFQTCTRIFLIITWQPWGEQMRCSTCGWFPDDFQLCNKVLYWLMMVLFDGGHNGIDFCHCTHSFWLPIIQFELCWLSAIQEYFMPLFHRQELGIAIFTNINIISIFSSRQYQYDIDISHPLKPLIFNFSWSTLLLMYLMIMHLLLPGDVEKIM